MANDFQTQFRGFHENIKLDDEAKVLTEKRERVLSRLREGLRKLFEERGKAAPTFRHFNQGSYAMSTGVKPLNGDYDIDVGLRFDISKEDYSDPVEVKRWVYEVLKNHTSKVDVRRPCVRVYYMENGEPAYHVDLAIYAAKSSDGKLYLARGKLNSSPENRVWEESDPLRFIELVRERFQGEERDQFRRVIRYLKRWRDVKFPPEGNAAPIGIGFTVAAYLWFQPQFVTVDHFSNKRRPDDLGALLGFVGAMLWRFSSKYHEGEWAERLQAHLPVAPGNDVFEKMTNRQMAQFKEKLEALRDALERAKNEESLFKACEILREQFGNEFPLPSDERAGRPTPPPVVGHSRSA